MKKRFFLSITLLLTCLCAVFAQADRIVGEYQCVHNGVDSRIKIFKYDDGYRAQCVWVSNLKKEDGGSVTDMHELERVVERDCDLIKAQMEIYLQHEPVVFICCGSGLLTMISRHVFNNSEIDRNAPLPLMKPDAGREAYFVGFNHPNARTANLAAKFMSIRTLIKR